MTNKQDNNSSSAGASGVFNTEPCLERVSYFILFHKKEYSFEFIKTFFPTEMAESQVKNILEADPRFCLIRNEEEELFVGRVGTNPNEIRLQQLVDLWKDNMSKFFRERTCDVKLCMLSQIIKRPEGLPKNIKLIDILNSDLQRRFLLISNPNNDKNDEVMVKYKCTPQEVEMYHEVWRCNIISFLLQQSQPVPLVTIGSQVIKPKNLGKNQKLIDVIKQDTQNRFEIFVDSSHNSLTRLSVSQEYCCECWRSQIYNLLNKSPHNQILKLDIIRYAPRPNALSKTIFLRDIILDDPQKRFQRAADYEKLLGHTPSNSRLFSNATVNSNVQATPHPHNYVSSPERQALLGRYECNTQQPSYSPPIYSQSNSSSSYFSPPSSKFMGGSSLVTDLMETPPGFFDSFNCSYAPRQGGMPLEKTISMEFSDFSPPPELLKFLNDSTPIPSFIERSVSAEFQDYPAIPGLLRFLSDTF